MGRRRARSVAAGKALPTFGSSSGPGTRCCWSASGRARQVSLDDQLDERLDAFPDALGLIGVLYPERLRHLANVEDALEVADDIRWWLHGSRGQKMPDRRVRTGSVAELADDLRALPLELEGADRVVAATGVVGYAIEQAANQVARHARTSRRITDVIASTDRRKRPRRGTPNRVPGALQTPSHFRTGLRSPTATFRLSGSL